MGLALLNPCRRARSIRAGRLVGWLVVAIGGRLIIARGSDRLRLGRLHLGLAFFALARLALAIAAAHFIIGRIGRGVRTRLAVSLPLAGRVHDAVVVLGMLIKVLGRDAVAARLGFPRHRDIAFEHLIGVAAYLDARTVAVEGLRAMWRAGAGAGAAAPTSAVMRPAATVTAARSLVLSWPHDTCLVAIDTGGPLV